MDGLALRFRPRCGGRVPEEVERPGHGIEIERALDHAPGILDGEVVDVPVAPLGIGAMGPGRRHRDDAPILVVRVDHVDPAMSLGSRTHR